MAANRAAERKEFPAALSAACCRFALALSCIAAVWLFTVSMLFTCRIRFTALGEILPPFAAAKFDNPFVNLAVLTAMLASLCLLRRNRKFMCVLLSIPPRTYALALIAAFFIGGCVFGCTLTDVPVGGDTYMVTTMGAQFLRGSYTALTDPAAYQNYLLMYPYQLNLIGFYAAVQAIVGVGNHAMIGCVNAFCLALAAGAVLRSCLLLTDDRRIYIVTVFMLATFLPLMPYCTYLYTLYPGLAACAWAGVFLVRYMHTERVIFLLLALLLGAFSVFLKINFFIWIIAMVVVALLFALKRRRWLPVLFSAALALSSLAAFRIYPSFCAERAGVTLAEGYPFSIWIKLGLNEGTHGPGYYDSVDESSLPEDHAAVCKQVDADVAARMAYLFAHPAKAARFFTLKAACMWDEPTFEMVWMNVRSRLNSEHPGVTSFFCGVGGDVLQGLLQFNLQFFYFALTVGLITGVRDRIASASPAVLLFPLVFLGAVLYYTVFEIKSMYAIIYFPILMPYAARGLVAAADAVRKGMERIGCKNRAGQD